MSKPEEEKESTENQGFKVRDRRRFDSEGTLREGVEEEAQESSPPSEEAPAGPPTSSADFSSLLLSLAANTQAALGVAPDPISGKLEVNLLQAKSMIDLLGVLQEKTKGNLTKEEEHLFQAMLYDLRMRYLEAQKKGE